MISGQHSGVVQLFIDISSKSTLQQNTSPRIAYIPSHADRAKYSKGKTCYLLKVRQQEHQKTVVQGEIEKSGMADHIWKERGNHLPLWNKVKIINREEHWKRRCLKEVAHMLGYVDLLSRPSIEMNTIWGPIIEKVKSNCFLSKLL